jgi:hypothetical protein
MSTVTQAEQLRARARHLRTLSSQVAGAGALTVYRLAGVDTWVGPTPRACADALLTMRRQLQNGQASLTDAARGLERRADAIERQPQTLGVALGTAS